MTQNYSRNNAPGRPAFARNALWLVCLFLITFAVGTDDFVIAGVLPQISTDLGVSEAVAGQLISVFSLTYALAAPFIAIWTSHLPRRPIMVVALTVFALSNVGAALATSYALLMTFRILAALCAASLTPVAFAMVGSLAPPERVGRYMGLVAAGLTLSLVIGVPLGTWLGATFSWRASFAFVTVLSGIVLAAVPFTLPKLPGTSESGIRQRLALLKRRPLLIGVASTVIGATGGLMTYSYIAPVTKQLSGLSPEQLAILIAAVGVAGALGTVMGGRATDRWGADRTLLVTLGGQVTVTAVLAGAGLMSYRVPHVLLVALFSLWGLAGWAFNPPMNTRILRLAGHAGTEAMALNTSGLYLGISIGGGIGGIAVASFGGTGVLLAAVGIGVVALIVLGVSVKHYPSGRDQRGADV